MTPFVAELLGTALVVTIGDGVVANNILPNTKGNNGGLITIVLGWVIAVFIGVYATSGISGGHLNPAVTIAFAAAGKFSWALVPSYILAQILGAMLGALLVWMIYKDQFNESKDPVRDQICLLNIWWQSNANAAGNIFDQWRVVQNQSIAQTLIIRFLKIDP